MANEDRTNDNLAAELHAAQAELLQRDEGLRRLTNKLIDNEAQANADRSQALEEQKEESARQQLALLKRSDAFKDKLLSILSHELRTPLNVILGYATILEDELMEQLTDEQRGYFEKLLGNADSLLGLVNDFLDMSRIQAGRLTIAPRLISFQEVVENVIASYEALGLEKGLSLINEVDNELPDLVADEQRIAQVVTNLLTNAIKFTPSGGTIRIRAKVEGERIRCEVQDTGIGISPEDLPTVFDLFSQLDMGSTRKTGGTGLGLAITRALVVAHGGSIGVQSRVGEGSTFWFTLPLTQAEPSTPKG